MIVFVVFMLVVLVGVSNGVFMILKINIVIIMKVNSKMFYKLCEKDL